MAALQQLKRELAAAGSSSEITKMREQLMLLVATGTIPSPIPYTDDLASLLECARSLKLKSGEPPSYKERVSNAFPLIDCVHNTSALQRQHCNISEVL
jgi:hypothetical protein